MEYPRMIYRTREDYKIVQTEEEHIQSKLEGWKDHWEDKDKEEPKRDVVDVPKDIPDDMVDMSMVNYKAETGRNALCDRGPYKGNPTKQFLKWKKTNGYS